MPKKSVIHDVGFYTSGYPVVAFFLGLYDEPVCRNELSPNPSTTVDSFPTVPYDYFHSKGFDQLMA